MEREELFLAPLDLGVKHFVFNFLQTYEVGEYESSGKMPFIWLQPGDQSCCTFVTGCGRLS